MIIFIIILIIIYFVINNKPNTLKTSKQNVNIINVNKKITKNNSVYTLSGGNIIRNYTPDYIYS
jgi:preprotein translocase subunit YajC